MTLEQKLTKEQAKISSKNHEAAWLYFGYKRGEHKGLVLHHKDKTLRYTNIERYILWLPEDLEVMTKSEHVSLHNHDKHTIKKGDENGYKKWAKANPDKHAEYQSKRVSSRNKTLWKDEEYRKKMALVVKKGCGHPILCVTTNKEFYSVNDAEKETGLSGYFIKKSADNNLEIKGYLFKWIRKEAAAYD